MEPVRGTEIVRTTRRNLSNYLDAGGNGEIQRPLDDQRLAHLETRIANLETSQQTAQPLAAEVQTETRSRRRRLPLGD